MQEYDDQLSRGLITDTETKKAFKGPLQIKKDPKTGFFQFSEDTEPQYSLLNATETTILDEDDNDGTLMKLDYAKPINPSNISIEMMPPKANITLPPSRNFEEKKVPEPEVRMINVNCERNEMVGCACFFCGNKVLIPKEAQMFQCFFCKQICDRKRPPQVAKQLLMCGSCRCIMQYTPISNYVKCTCGTINYVPLPGQTANVVPQPGGR